MNPSPLDALHDSRRGGTPVVTYGFLGLCVIATITASIFPPIEDLLSGIDGSFFWQRLTAVFMHGWPGFPAFVHLALNAFLILECGRPCERLLGSTRFLLLSTGSMLANAVLQTLTAGVNGSSLVIWSWGPPLFLALWLCRRSDTGADPSAGRIRAILILMYVVITIVMSGLPYLAGWRGNPLTAFLMGNQFHIVATFVGIAFALGWRTVIERRLQELRRSVTGH